VSKGILDSSNRLSLTTPTTVSIGAPTVFPITLLPNDYTFATGHQIGVILVANYTGFASVRGTTGATVTMDTKASTVTLPVTGGSAAAIASGGFDRIAPTLTVPADRTAAAPDGEAGVAVSWPAPAATDDIDPSPAVACTPASGSAFPIGVTTVSCTATDASGNPTTGTFVVTVTVKGKAGDPGQGGDGGQTIGGTPVPQPDLAHGTPSGQQSTTPPATLDRVPAPLTRLTLSGRHRRLLASFVLAKDATVTVSIRKRGAKKAAKSAHEALRGGKRTLRINGLKPGRYVVTITTVPKGGGPRRTYTRSLTVRAG
jgi:hypothetical protein